MFVYHKTKKERENVFATAMNIFLPILALLQLLIPGAGLVVVLTTDVNALLPVGIPRRRYYTQERRAAQVDCVCNRRITGKKRGPSSSFFFFFLLVIAPVKDGPCGQRRR